MLSFIFLGDIVGRPGRQLVLSSLDTMRTQFQADFILANAENAAGGAGLTAALAETLGQAGLNGMTLGDHVWDQRNFDQEISSLAGVCRPANLPERCPGRDHLILERKGLRLGLFTVLGRTFMNMKVGCPFVAADRMLMAMEQKVDAVFVEIHAETTAEKIAFGRYLDGRVAAVLGTHTHVPTADAAILPKGTAYQTDVGMCGPYDSVIGREVDAVVETFLDGMKRRYEVASGDVRIAGTLVRVDAGTGLAREVEPFVLRA